MSDLEERTPLHWAAISGHVEILEALCKVANAPIDRVDARAESVST